MDFVERAQSLYFLQTGTDAPGRVWIPGRGWVPTPGWGIDMMRDFARAATVVNYASQIRVPGLGEAIAHEAIEFIQKEAQTHLTNGGIVFVQH